MTETKFDYTLSAKAVKALNAAEKLRGETFVKDVDGGDWQVAYAGEAALVLEHGKRIKPAVRKATGMVWLDPNIVPALRKVEDWHDFVEFVKAQHESDNLSFTSIRTAVAAYVKPVSEAYASPEPKESENGQAGSEGTNGSDGNSAGPTSADSSSEDTVTSIVADVMRRAIAADIKLADIAAALAAELSK